MKKSVFYLFLTALASVAGYMFASRSMEEKRDFR